MNSCEMRHTLLGQDRLKIGKSDVGKRQEVLGSS